MQKQQLNSANKTKKIVFVNIYSTDTIAKYTLASYVLKNFLKKSFTEKELVIDVLNFSKNADTSDIYSQIIEKNPDYVGYSCYVWNVDKMLSIIAKLKESNPEIRHILGGPEIAINKIEAMKPENSGDYFIVGEGEKTLKDLVGYLLGKVDEIPRGVAYWNEGKLNYFQHNETISNLDEIPSAYLDASGENGVDVGWQAFLETQRGCKFRCQFCLYHKNLPQVTYFSLDRVFAELDFLIIKKKIKALRILDAIFTSDLERAKKIVKHLIDIKNIHKVTLPWIYWEYTVYHVDDEFLKLASYLKNKEHISNCSSINPLDRPQMYSEMLRDYTTINCIGVQSFNLEALKSVSRFSVSKERFDSFMKSVNEYNLALKIDMILGLPFESFDSYFDGIEYLTQYFKNTDHVMNIHVLQILPGSDLEQHCDFFKLRYFKESSHYVYATNAMSEEELGYASKLSGVLFRILNSPLRKHFFETKERIGKSFMKIAEHILKNILESEQFKNTSLVKEKVVNDEYWNNNLYRDIPSEWIIGQLAQLK